MNKEKLDAIKGILHSEYGNKLSDEDINGFADDLYYSLFEWGYGLDEIIPTIYSYEEKAETEYSSWYYIFGCMIDLMDNGKETAERIYNCFMFSWDILELFLKLYLENDEYISEAKLKKAKKKALHIFDKEILKLYGITE